MKGINKIILIGNLGNDPKIMTFDNNLKKASFSLATTETYQNREGNKVDHTEWHNIVLWRGLAEVAEKYLSKGNQVYIEGRIRQRSWKDDQGNDKYITEINADNLTMLGGRNTSNNVPAEPPQQKAAPNNEPQPDDDLPF